MAKLDKVKSFKLHTGYSAETSGGIMMLVDKACVNDLISEMRSQGEWCWEIGEVVKGEKNEACLDPSFRILEISDQEEACDEPQKLNT